MKSILHLYEIWTTNDQVHSLVVVGLHLHFIFACLRAPNVRNHLNSNDLLSFGCCLLARSTLLIPSTKHLKYSLDHHFHFSLPSHAWLTYKRWQVPHREKWPLSKESSLILTWFYFVWLILQWTQLDVWTWTILWVQFFLIQATCNSISFN